MPKAPRDERTTRQTSPACRLKSLVGNSCTETQSWAGTRWNEMDPYNFHPSDHVFISPKQWECEDDQRYQVLGSSGVREARERQHWGPVALERELEILWSPELFVHIPALTWEKPRGSRICVYRDVRLQISFKVVTYVLYKAGGQILFAFDYKENIITGLLHILENDCQLLVVGINSASTGVPNLGCSEGGNFIHCSQLSYDTAWLWEQHNCGTAQ